MYSQTHTYIHIYIYTCFGIGVSMYVCMYAQCHNIYFCSPRDPARPLWLGFRTKRQASVESCPSRIYQGLIHASYHGCSFQGAMTTLLPFSGGSSWLPSLVVGNRCPGDMCQVRHSLPLKLLDSRWALPALAGPLAALPKPGQL